MNINGIVLAGGRSSRMGCDKRLLKIQGEQLIDRAIRICAETLGQSIQQITISGHLPGYACIQDQVVHQGPLGGLMSIFKYWLDREADHTLHNTGKEHFLLLIPVDMPLLTPSLLNLLTKELEVINQTSSNSVDVLIFKNHELPMLIRCHSAILSIIESTLNSELPSQRSLQALLKQLKVRTILPNSEDYFLNTNDPSDWDRVKGQYHES